jgi:glutaredoxin
MSQHRATSAPATVFSDPGCGYCRQAIAYLSPFGSTVVDCSDAGASAQCRAANVAAYPTIVYADGTRQVGWNEHVAQQNLQALGLGRK